MTAFSIKTLALAVVITFYFAGSAAAQDQSEKEKRGDFNNMVTVGVGTLAFSNYNGILVPADVQFRRTIKKNLSWSVIFQYFHEFDEHSTCGCGDGPGSHYNPVWQRIGVVAGRFHYSIPVVRRWLHLTMGAGLGLGYHYFSDRDYDNRNIGNKVLPYATAEVQWELRLGRRGVVRISPLILSPSRVYVTTGGPNRPLDQTFCMLDIIHLSYGVRF